MHPLDRPSSPAALGLALLTLSLAAAIPFKAVAAEACPAAVPYPDGIQVVKAIRVFTASGGESAFETVTFASEGQAYFKPGQIFSHATLGAAKKVQIVSGPANAAMPYHASPYREMFLTIQGSSTVVLPDGKEAPATPGTLIIMDDMGSKTGHAGRTGPCGYVAINVVPVAEAGR